VGVRPVRLGKFIEKLKMSIKRGLETGDDDQGYTEKDDNSTHLFTVKDLPPEKERELIDKIAARIKELKIEAPSIMILETFKPVNSSLSQLYGFYAAPFLEIFGIRGYEYANFLNKKKNVRDLINKIRENEEDN
jgi:hypothetical protein